MGTRQPTMTRVIVVAVLSSLSFVLLLVTAVPWLLTRVSFIGDAHFVHRLLTLYHPPSSSFSSSHLYHSSQLPSSGCAFPLVYNKPPKTASSFIQEAITNWTQRVNRPNYMCSNRPTYTNVLLHECVPPLNLPSTTTATTFIPSQSSSSELAASSTNEHDINQNKMCGVVNCHLYLDQHAQSLLSERLPGYHILTSTRNPAHRILSFFLHFNNIRLDAPSTTNSTSHSEHITRIHDRLSQFFDSFEPWRLYNYHTGGDRVGSCPLTQSEKGLIFMMAGRYHIVIDANVREASNKILQHHGLFQLPEEETMGGKRHKDRGGYKLELTESLTMKLNNVACVEIMLHTAMQTRMASLYEQATGERCIFKNETCIGRMEEEELKSNWIF